MTNQNPPESNAIKNQALFTVLFIFRIFTQPQVKSALKMFGDQLDWMNNLLEDYMKDSKLAPAINGSDSRTVTDKKKSTSSRLSFKSKK